MKDMDLMKAMNDLDDDILREAETFEIKKRRGRVLPRIAAVAAVVALLCVSVYAVVAGVQIGFTGRTEAVPNEDGASVTYSEAEIVYDLSWHEIPAESMEVLQQHLEDHWLWCRENRRWSLSGDSFVTFYHQEEYEEEMEEGWHDPGPGAFTFDTFEEAEEFLGLTLDVPPVLREAIMSSEGIALRVLTDPIGEEAYLPSASDGDVPELVTPGGVELMFFTEHPTDDLWVLNGKVIIPLTEAFAAEPYADNLFCSTDYQDITRIEGFTQGVLEGQMLYRTPVAESEYDDLRNGCADAFYVLDGIGYAIYSCPSDNCESDDPREVLLSYLEEIK